MIWKKTFKGVRHEKIYRKRVPGALIKGDVRMDVVLINAPVTRVSPHARHALPLGLAYIASVLQKEGRSVQAIDFNVSGLNLRRVDMMLRRNPVIVGISCHTETYPNALKIARRIKEQSPRVFVVLGGPHVTILPKEALSDQAVDFVVIGEGEATMAELAAYLLDGRGELSRIKGIGYKDENGQIRLNPRRELLDPDTLPYPARELFPLELYEEKWNFPLPEEAVLLSAPFVPHLPFGKDTGGREARKILLKN